MAQEAPQGIAELANAGTRKSSPQALEVPGAATGPGVRWQKGDAGLLPRLFPAYPDIVFDII
jgi:hypothetical protein